MINLNELTEAIRNRKQISFEYNKLGKISGERIGNPHAVFILTTLAGIKSTKIHIVQTGGVSDSKVEKPFPDFRMFNIEDLSNLKLLNNLPIFEPFFEKYKPEWDGYKDVIEKV